MQIDRIRMRVTYTWKKNELKAGRKKYIFIYMKRAMVFQDIDEERSLNVL